MRDELGAHVLISFGGFGVVADDEPVGVADPHFLDAHVLGTPALESRGQASRPKLSEALFAVLEQELARGPAAHGWPDQTWTLARIKTLIGRRFHKSMTLSAIAQMLHRHGFSHQVPARRATERDEGAVTGWVKETWPQVETPWRRSGPGCASNCAVRRCVSCGGERPSPLTCRSREVELGAA
ncbi:helix-turn-helix domain-containing protein [Streptomyces ipomoeae]|uniref:helix-turn-helix domain-containing protein n=1 Tax=Streptomyces ipomoeae TaxID=103232 RepID=UPI0029BEAA1D|nr:winged helix-turn-helix domain-containing protein [Streptomyces ipomoeae]MDX2939310.1 winged helix-turn-helix domain-containing protein [Streptomyces ipomoeae]